MRSWVLVLLTACDFNQPPPDGADTDAGDTDTDTTSETDDTDIVWPDTSDDGGGGDDTFRLGHPNLGATPLDGVWSGTYQWRQVFLGSLQASCIGTLSLTIDGTAFWHVSGDAACSDWDPNFNFEILPGQFEAYGPMTGFVVAELNPTTFERVSLDVTLMATNMPEYMETVVASVDGDHLTVVSRSPGGGTGTRFDVDLTRR